MPEPPPLSRIVNLARTGAITQAWAMFTDTGLADVIDDPKILTLKGRLLKDQARQASGPMRARLFLEAAQAYADAARIRPDSYPLINAAAMSLFAGQQDHMRFLAREVLGLLDGGGGVGETPYWHEATRAEALLLLGDMEGAQAALAAAVANAPDAWEDRATTIRQFREIAEALGLSVDWLASLAPPPTLVFSGIMGIGSADGSAQQGIEAAVQQSGVGSAYGALAAGADILVAEAVLRAGAALNIVLPAAPEAFRRQSVEPFGADWSSRFDAMMDQAESVTVVAGCNSVTDGSIKLAALVAQGMAMDKAQRMQSRCTSISITDERRDGAAADNIIVNVDRSVQDGVSTEVPPSKMAMLIAGVDRQLFARYDLAEMAILHGMHVAASFDIEHAATVLARLIESRSTGPLAANAIVAENAHDISDVEIARTVRIAQSTTQGTIGAIMEAAMVLKAFYPEAGIEPLGELPDQGRASQIYALRNMLRASRTIAGGNRFV
ncbi:MAG: DUF4071 domain-containing protein [Sphingomonadaceae bacterium]|nr:DUF4071 domain-containing protein [Sphingomonadaceae bacterium]